MKYVRCVNNAGFICDQDGKPFDETIDDLVIGQVYKVAPPAPNDGDMLRVIDASGEDYLYPPDYFEPLTSDGNGGPRRPITIYVSDFTRGILHAEALAARKSISALLRDWIDERLDSPATSQLAQT
jgi:hypothetical protein